MLTKVDLKKIQELLRAEIGNETASLKSDVLGEIKLARIEIQNDLREIEKRVKNTEIVTSKIQKDIKAVIEFLDGE
ncbi:MAG: hypothetical protein Q7S03_04095 [bacterium]|nr:hypothetical protein [bacterium]